MTESIDSALNQKLQRLIETLDIANLLTEPITRSIRNLLEVSAAELNSAEASVLIRDGNEGELRFLAAIGAVADKLLNIRIPPGKGIAGFVLSSGQPLVVSDVGEDEAFYDEVDKTTGYSTEMVLATPLRHNGEVIGVLEYINRRGDAPNESFTPEEMDKAAFFAEAVSSLVSTYESAKLFRDFGENVLAHDFSQDVPAIRAWLAGLRDSAEHREMMDLAVMLREISSRGEPERELCRKMLEAMIKYMDHSAETSFLNL